jgi:uncharacterized protein (TIGR02145 family)
MNNKTKFCRLSLMLIGLFFFFVSSCDVDSGGSFTDPRDGNVYKTVTIGKQVWMAENLRYVPSIVGPRTGSRTTAYYYIYDCDGTSVSVKAAEIYATYGVLYNLTAALSACPPGWHLPSNDEWAQLSDYLGNGAGGKLKTTGTIESETGLWHSPNTGATNNKGFSALPGGIRDNDGTFKLIGSLGTWWCADKSSAGISFFWLMGYNHDVLDKGLHYQDLGLSVRCVRD